MATDLIFSEKPKFSLVILFLSIEIDPIFFKYHPNTGILSSSFFKIKIGALNIVCKKKFQMPTDENWQ